MATDEEQFQAHLASGDTGDCPGCGSGWEGVASHVERRSHRADCPYQAWLKKVGKPKAAVK